jgi:hypothetical protein
MDVSTQVGRDHPIDLKRLSSNPNGSVAQEHLLTFVPVEFRGGAVKFCFVGRSDVDILRAGARNSKPPELPKRSPGRFSNLAMTLRAGDLVSVGTKLLTIQVISVAGNQAVLKMALQSEDLLLNLMPLGTRQELNLREIVERLNRGSDYRSDAL